MNIHIETLRAALNQLLDHAKEMKGNFVEIDEDLYWHIPTEFLHEAAKSPPVLTLGSLEDDWAEISAIGSGEKEAIGHALVWAAAILRAIGEVTP